MRKYAFTMASLLSAVSFCAMAQSYPDKPITMIVPFSAGGPTDTVARLTAEAMSQELGQQVVVQNVGGAGGTLGAGQAAQAAPDGYTILVHHIGMSTAPSLYANLPYDPVESFEPIGLVTNAPMTIIGRKDMAEGTLQELVTAIKADPQAYTLANAGVGAASHLCSMLFMSAIDTEMTTVPYQGNGPIMTDLLGGHVDLTCDQTTNTTQPILDGQVKAYAVTTPGRIGQLPDVPTATEAGLDDFVITVWHGVYAPKGIEPNVRDALVSALQKGLTHEKLVQRFTDLGTAPVTQADATPEALETQLTSQIEFWRPFIERAGLAAGQ
ncbi:protein in the TAR-I ttuE-ttuC' intergenic region [Aureimonas altamirensis]|uniref:Protein in the TAR-I ttuE-ttuC' intergenic region n=1 Tax=Aureimonas altamirensis TaxID=370622 RepID=A0A0B1Q246_9HYPH|nr:tripartite tricarboxylate transporter substrate-binding protein [Aureimonas altamirensis]KHJ54444.1 protein in the TAR-I ttuE-ttuC' intergenic region [Aureimonas altamirensis]